MELYRGLLQHAYNNFLGNPGQLTTINRLKAQMLQHQRNFSMKFRRINETFISGESTTLFHVAQVYGKRAKTTISQLGTENDNTISDSSQINHMLRSFFEDLYSADDQETLNTFHPAKVIPENNHDNAAVMCPITPDEVIHALKSSSSRKTPGSDGLPKEFYQKTWTIIGTELTHVINDALLGRAKKEYYDGVIVLVKKKGRDKSVKGYPTHFASKL